ncbi:hypothetical protein SAY87_027412 [Trapa incisa]|uniref:Calmodulin-binding protein n=2 Tax=Trapa TaxID=22665 RepID=A0AAN7RBG5_TRANT|nr:hypothetical protein SAY87_027412 [Trapa incisa]KAK4799009.1 hypothetical protein SAY86_024374 [Trapa natans]
MDTLSATPLDFDFHSTASSPYATAPASPEPFGQSGHHLYNLSAPTSPTQPSSPHLNSLFFREINRSRRSLSAIPFHWEDSPGVPKHKDSAEEGAEDDFEFDFSGQLDIRASASAEELFDGGKIRPLKLPPRLQVGSVDGGSGSLSPRTPRSRFSPKKKFAQRKDFDPFVKALEETRKSEAPAFQLGELPPVRGRDRNIGPLSSSSNYPRRATRSLSPLRVSDIVFDEEASKVPYSPTTSATAQPTSNAVSNKGDNTMASYFSSLLSSISFSKGYRKWSFRDFLLFRSASEGRGTRQDPLRRYATVSRKVAVAAAEDARSCSFRSTDSTGSSVSRSRRRSRANLSAHEIHYTKNRAASEEMRKKTFLPYKQGLLGCLGFNPGMNEKLARGFESLTTRG